MEKADYTVINYLFGLAHMSQACFFVDKGKDQCWVRDQLSLLTKFYVFVCMHVNTLQHFSFCVPVGAVFSEPEGVRLDFDLIRMLRTGTSSKTVTLGGGGGRRSFGVPLKQRVSVLYPRSLNSVWTLGRVFILQHLSLWVPRALMPPLRWPERTAPCPPCVPGPQGRVGTTPGADRAGAGDGKKCNGWEFWRRPQGNQF